MRITSQLGNRAFPATATLALAPYYRPLPLLFCEQSIMGDDRRVVINRLAQFAGPIGATGVEVAVPRVGCAGELPHRVRHIIVFAVAV
jgi:hypothetical protein